METFYDTWLEAWNVATAERGLARKVIHEEELTWVETPQDFRTALLIAPETGFRTCGTVTLLAEIPSGCHSGCHSHGEESAYVLSGEGFTVVDGLRFDWSRGSALLIPFGAKHQHFNTGKGPARIFSAMAVGLERFLGMHRLVQVSGKGRTDRMPESEPSEDGCDANGERVVLSMSAARTVDASEGPERREVRAADLLGDDGQYVAGDSEGMRGLRHLHRPAAQYLEYMRVSRVVNGFHPHEVEISGVLTDLPGERSGMHAHMEALLYIVSGEGHSIIDDDTVQWRSGSALHIQGPQTRHQHFNDGRGVSAMLRVAPGIRYFFEGAAKREFPYLFLKSRDEK